MKSALGVILFSFCFFLISHSIVLAETTTKVLIGPDVKAKPGGTAVIPIKVHGVPNPGVGSMQGIISYPAELLEIKESDLVPVDRDNYLIVAGRVGGDDESEEVDLTAGASDQIGFILVCIARVCKTNGIIFQVNAKVLGEDGDEGEVKISLEKFNTAADPPESLTSFEIINGTVTIAEGGGGTGKCDGLPSANFRFDISGFDVTFTDQSRASGGSDCRIVSWSWDFGDSKRDSLQNPRHKYDRAGCFNVTVTVTDSEGNARTSSPQTVVIGTTLPTVNFDFSPKSNINAGDVVTFTNTSTPLSGPTFSWNFGDGTTSAEQSPRHAFFKSGNVTVTLTATTSGCSASKSQTMTVTTPKRPLVRAWPNPVTHNTKFGFSLPDQAKSSGVVKIFTMAGKGAGEVKLNSQSGEVSWNVPSDLPNGPYYYVLIAGGLASKVGKLVVHR